MLIPALTGCRYSFEIPDNGLEPCICMMSYICADSLSNVNVYKAVPVQMSGRADMSIESAAYSLRSNGKETEVTSSEIANYGICLSGERFKEGDRLELTFSAEGMDMWATVDTENNTEARALYSAVGRGDISGMSFMFSIDDEEWENLESDHPTRRIKKIGTIVEVSAVTFPAYDSTIIDARSKEALDNARSALENARQLREKSVDTDLELAKAKFTFLSKL